MSHTKWANCRDRKRHLRDLVKIRPISRRQLARLVGCVEKRALAPSMPAGTRPGRQPASCQLVNFGMSKTDPCAPARRPWPFKPTGGAPLPSQMCGCLLLGTLWAISSDAGRRSLQRPDPHVPRPSPSSSTGERRGRRDPGPARPGRAPAPLQAPGAAGALDGEVLTNKSSQGRADAQRLVATRLLDRVHDPLGHFSRLQRIYPRAR